MKIEFPPDVISLLEKAKFYKSQTITKINPDNYGFKNEYNTWFGRPDTNHKDRTIMLSEADAKYVWKNSIFKSNTLSIIPWADTEKGGIWQIEISQELLAKYIDNYIKNIKVDNKSVIYNSNNELSVPFDNDSIYEENGLWKAKQGGNVSSDIIKDSELNKDYIEKVDGKYIVKTAKDLLSNYYYDANTIDNFLVNKQDKLVSGTNIKTINGNSLLGSGDVTISGGNDWEIVNTSDFKPNDTQYILPITPNGIYNYKVELGYLKDNKTIYKSSLIFSEKNFDKNYDVVVGNTFQFSGLPIFTISISLIKGYQNAVINLLNQNNIKYEIQTLNIERKKVN